MFRTRMAVMAVALLLSGLALAHDRDDRRDDGRYGNGVERYGYDNGYRDGLHHGREDRARNAGYDYRHDEWKHADRGYHKNMGSKGQYKEAYRQGYQRGYEDAYNGRRGGIWNGPVWGGGQRDDDWYGRDDDRYGRNAGWYGQGGYNDGYRDGVNSARYDRRNGGGYNLAGNAWYRKGHGPGDRPGEDSSQYQRAYREGFARGYNEGYRR